MAAGIPQGALLDVADDAGLANGAGRWLAALRDDLVR